LASNSEQAHGNSHNRIIAASHDQKPLHPEQTPEDQKALQHATRRAATGTLQHAKFTNSSQQKID
jgi:hypothetical protein